MKKKEIYVIIGQRGAGKTTWAKSAFLFFKKKGKPVLFFDTDEEMEKKFNKSIHQLYHKGESFFRKEEIKVFRECIRQAKCFQGLCFISTGAGFKGAIPSFCKAIHLQRPSDLKGRIFFNRPRILSKKYSSLEEFHKIQLVREPFYEKTRDLVLTRLDYFKNFSKWDKVFLEGPLPFKNGVLTLNPKKTLPEKLEFSIEHKLNWSFKFFEIRDDLFNKKNLDLVLKKIPQNKILFSFRKKNKTLFKNICQKGIVDWSFEWGENKKLHPDIYSLHQRKKSQTLGEQLKEFSKVKNAHLKLAVEIHSFKELWQGHSWQRQNPGLRSFHPCSKNGRWMWQRLLFGPHQPFYFIREGVESAVLDQPFMAESVRVPEGISPQGFACVIGDPVSHSATPFEQGPFLKKHRLPAVKILMKENEMTLQNFKILEKFNLQFCAVTSPLKKKAYKVFKNSFFTAKNDADLAKQEPQNEKFISFLQDKCLKTSRFEKQKKNNLISSINTLIQTSAGWKGFNTDIEGALALKKIIDGNAKTAVWGGGGVRNILKLVFDCNNLSTTLTKNKYFAFFSARSGKLVYGEDLEPEIVVWAVGRERMPFCLYPPPVWKPRLVVDLNYAEDSPGREYALKANAEYKSGWFWFKAQAKAQRKLFQTFGGGDKEEKKF